MRTRMATYIYFRPEKESKKSALEYAFDKIYIHGEGIGHAADKSQGHENRMPTKEQCRVVIWRRNSCQHATRQFH